MKQKKILKGRSTIFHSRLFTLKCMIPKCIARVARAKTPSAATAQPAASMGIKTCEGLGMMRKLHPLCIPIRWAPHPWAHVPRYHPCHPYLLALQAPHLFHHPRHPHPPIRSAIWRTWTRCSAWQPRTLTSTAVSFSPSPLHASSSCIGSFTSIWATMLSTTLSISILIKLVTKPNFKKRHLKITSMWQMLMIWCLIAEVSVFFSIKLAFLGFFKGKIVCHFTKCFIPTILCWKENR